MGCSPRCWRGSSAEGTGEEEESPTGCQRHLTITP